jgi:hypothetical protein
MEGERQRKTYTRGGRLERLAEPLDPLRPPYYVWTPLAAHEQAAGWYLVNSEGEHVFLGGTAVRAELRLLQLVDGKP